MTEKDNALKASGNVFMILGLVFTVIGASGQHTFLWIGIPLSCQPDSKDSGSPLRSVVIQGRPERQVHGESDTRTLEPGSYFGSQGQSTHLLSSESESGTNLSVRTNGRFRVIPE